MSTVRPRSSCRFVPSEHAVPAMDSSSASIPIALMNPGVNSSRVIMRA